MQTITSYMTPIRHRVTLLALSICAGLATAARPAAAHAQWATTYEQFYLPGKFNFTFRRDYPAADRLFNAFDYGHAILYERLYTDPQAPVSRLEKDEFNFITQKLLVSPPRLPLEEAAIEVSYAKMAPEAKAMFDWAHLLHRQIYDVLAWEEMPPLEKDAKIAELVAYYKTRPDLAFSSLPKSMELMEEQPYSLAFRRRYPTFNGLIWGYHWLQVALYEPLMVGRSPDERQAGVAAAVSRFRQMLENAPEHLPRVMPMTAAIAPTFARRYQEAAIIFDNLHAMHDVVSDILANESVPRRQKRAAILEAGSRYRDSRSFLMPVSEWASMGEMMGVENMGGPAVGILPAWPAATLARGATMAEAMQTMQAMPEMAAPHAAHAAPAAHATAAADSADAQHAVEAFRSALARGDSATALALLAPDVVVLEAGGVERLADYRSHHLAADIAFARAVPSQHVLTSLRVDGNTAWVASTSVTQGQFDGRPVNSAGAELMVLTRAASGAPWLIRAIHWSSRRRQP